MNWLLTAACAGFALIALGVGARRDDATLSRAQLLGLLAIPPLLIALCVWTAQGRMDQLRLVLDKVTADDRALQSGPLTIGGGASAGTEAAKPTRPAGAGREPAGVAAPCGGAVGAELGARRGDDIVSAGLPAGMIIACQSEGVVTVEARPMAGARGDVAGVVSTGRRETLRFVGAQPFNPGDAVCLAQCGPGARWLTLSPGGDRLIDAQGELPPLPARKIWRIVGGVAEWNAAQRIYPLRDFGLRGPRPQAVNPCSGRFLCVVDPVDGVNAPVRSFLFRRGGPPWAGGRQMWILLLDPDARIRTAAGTLVAPAGRERLLSRDPPSGEGSARSPPSKQVSIWGVHYVDAEADPGDPAAPPSQLVERRAMTLTADDDGLAVRLDTPKVVVANPDGEPPADAYWVTGEVPQGAPVSQQVRRLDFEVLGGETASNVAGDLKLGRAATEQTFLLGSPRTSPSGARQADFHVERLTPPWIVVFVAALSGVVLYVTLKEAWLRNPVACLLTAGLQLLLAIRWLVGWEGVFLDETLDWRAVMISDGVAYVTLPAIFAAAGLWPGPSGQKGFGLAAFVACAVLAMDLDFSAATAWRRVAPFDAVLTLSAVGLALAAGLGAARLGRWTGATRRHLRLDRLGASTAARAAQGWRWLAGLPVIGPAIHWTSQLPAWAWVLGAGPLFRVGVGLFGVKERFTFPETLAVSVVYLPWMLLGFALLFDAAGKARRENWGYAAGFVAAIALDMFGAPILMSDSGFAILSLPIVFWALAFAHRSAGAGPAAAPPAASGRNPWLLRAAWSGPALALSLGLAVALVLPRIWTIGATEQAYERAAQATDDRMALGLLRRNTQSDQLTLRFFTLASPNLLATTGTSEAEKLRVWSAYLNDYTARMLGRGYMQTSRFGPLQDVHLSDNVSAVHVMSPFGRLGAAALLAALAALAVACQRLAPAAAPGVRDWRSTLGLLSLWTLFGGGAYMVLANLQLAPFTGRNLYLLAAKSNSDLAEGAALFLMAYWGLARRRPA